MFFLIKHFQTKFFRHFVKVEGRGVGGWHGTCTNACSSANANIHHVPHPSDITDNARLNLLPLVLTQAHDLEME